MYKVEIDDTFHGIILAFYQFGIWRNDEESEFRKSCMKSLHLIFYFSFIVFLLFCAFINDDKGLQFFLVEMDISIAVIEVKTAYLLYRKDEILKFLYHPIVITDYGESVEVNKKIKIIMKFIQVYSVALIVTLIILTLAPLPMFTSERKLLSFIPLKLGSDYDTIFYWFAYVYTTICAFFTLTYNFVMVFIWYIMYNYSVRYKILGNQFRRLGHETSLHSFHRDFVDLICAHRYLVEYERHHNLP